MGKKSLWLGCLLFPVIASAQSESFREVAQHTLLTNPEIQVRFHSWQAAKEERTAAAGGFLPRVDISGVIAREHEDNPLLRDSYTQRQATLTLTQMLFDGLATHNEVARLDHAALVRFFELHDVSETTALEVVRAYADVVRYRELVTLAEENYARHRGVFDLIQEKVQAGVGRRVDLETSSGRLALAESNLLTEMSNLHDVTARFVRITGKVPAADLGTVPTLSHKMPENAKAALAVAIERNPGLWAALQNVRSAKSALRTRNASYTPRLEFRAQGTEGRNVNGVPGSDRAHSVGLVLNWNLFNGGADNARERQFSQQVNAAQDALDRACREVRQTLLIAYNDAQKLAAQINYLDQHQLSTEKARDAYRKQFDIGQRSLLDLLDTENELFQARRAYTNALHDQEIAYARVSASMGQLIPTLGLVAPGSDLPSPLLQDDEVQALIKQCQVEPPISFAMNKEAIDKRITALKKEAAANAAVGSAAPPPLEMPLPSSNQVPTGSQKK